MDFGYQPFNLLLTLEADNIVTYIIQSITWIHIILYLKISPCIHLLKKTYLTHFHCIPNFSKLFNIGAHVLLGEKASWNAATLSFNFKNLFVNLTVFMQLCIHWYMTNGLIHIELLYIV